MLTYSAFGLLIESVFSLPVPQVRVIDEFPRADVRLESGTVDLENVDFAPLDSVEDLTAVWMNFGWDGERVVLSFPNLVAELRARSPLIVIDSPTVDADYVTHIVLDHVLPRWLALQGSLVLHAGSVVSPSGQAIVFVGETGRGKSSMVTALGGLGWPLLGDDGCRVSCIDGVWYARPSYPGVRLTGTSRHALVPGVDSRPMALGSDKHRVAAGLTTPGELTPMGLVVELGPERDVPAMRRLTLSEATATLTRHSFHLAPSLKQVAPQAFMLSSGLAAAVPCVASEHRRSWDVYPELIPLLQAAEATTP